MDNEKNIKIPIKKIVENSAKNFGCDFNYDDMSDWLKGEIVLYVLYCF